MDYIIRMGGYVLIMYIMTIIGYSTVSSHYIAKSTVGWSTGLSLSSSYDPIFQNSRVISENGDVVFVTNDYHIHLYDAHTHQITTIDSGANNISDRPNISLDGRYISFWSVASNIISGGTNSWPEYFIYDRLSDTFTSSFYAWTGSVGGNGNKLSQDGRYVLRDDGNFPSRSLMLWDSQSNTVRTVASIVYIDDEYFSDYDISADSKSVVFTTSDANVVSGDTNDRADIFVYDIDTATIIKDTTWYTGAIDTYGKISISPDARYVTLYDNQYYTTMLYDTDHAIIKSIVSGHQVNDAKFSPNSNHIIFQSYSSGIIAGDTNGMSDLFIYEVDTDTITASTIHVNSGNIVVMWGIGRGSISDNAQYVAFWGQYTHDAGIQRIFVYDRINDTIIDLIPHNDRTMEYPRIAYDGKYLVFGSQATNLVPNDDNNRNDLFFYVFDRQSPTLTLSGSAVVSIPLHTTWIDPGANWTDDIDGTGSILTPSSGYVDTTIPGTYVLEYTYTDKAGNTGNTVTREVLVVSLPVSNGGGGGYSFSKDHCPNGDYSPSYYDGTCEGNTPQPTTNEVSPTLISPSIFNPSISPDTCFNPLNQSTIDQGIKVTEQFKIAHQMLYSYGLTKRQGTADYRPYDTLTRQEAAKFMVEFAQKVLCRKPTKTYINNFSDIDNADPTLIPFIKASYEYNIFKGDVIHTDQSQQTTFRPHDIINTDELIAVMMRLVTNQINDNDGEDWAGGYRATYNTITSSSLTTVNRGQVAEGIYAVYKKSNFVLHNIGYMMK